MKLNYFKIINNCILLNIIYNYDFSLFMGDLLSLKQVYFMIFIHFYSPLIIFIHELKALLHLHNFVIHSITFILLDKYWSTNNTITIKYYSIKIMHGAITPWSDSSATYILRTGYFIYFIIATN